MANGMTIRINTEEGMKEFSVMELWNQAYNDYRYVNTFFDQLKNYSSTIGTVENNIINNLLSKRLDTYFKTTVSRPGTIAKTSLAGFSVDGIQNDVRSGIQQVSTQMVQSKIKFAYPSVTKDSSFQLNNVINTTSNVRFVYPSVK